MGPSSPPTLVPQEIVPIKVLCVCASKKTECVCLDDTLNEAKLNQTVGQVVTCSSLEHEVWGWNFKPANWIQCCHWFTTTAAVLQQKLCCLPEQWHRGWRSEMGLANLPHAPACSTMSIMKGLKQKWTVLNRNGHHLPSWNSYNY